MHMHNSCTKLKHNNIYIGMHIYCSKETLNNCDIENFILIYHSDCNLSSLYIFYDKNKFNQPKGT